MKNSVNKMKGFGRYGLNVIGGLALLFMASSCLDDSDVPDPLPIAYVSFYHGAPQVDQLSISVDNRPYNNNPIRFGDYFDYGNFYTGDRNFSFRNPGASSSLLDTLVTLKASQAYSVFFVEQEDLFEPVIVEDKLSNPGEGKALIRLAHLSPDTQDISLVIDEEEEATIENQSFGEVSAYKAVDSGVVKVAIKESASADSDLVAANEVNLREGRIYTLVVRGYSESSQGTEKKLSLQLLRNYPNF